MSKDKIFQVDNLSNHLFIGADIHKNDHTFVALNHTHRQVGVCQTSDDPKDLTRLKIWLEKLKPGVSSKLAIGLEDSGGNGEKLAEFLVEAGFKVLSVSPSLTAARRLRTIHRDKSDLGDALLVAKITFSEYDQLPKVVLNKQIKLAKQLKGLIDDYDSLTKTSVSLKNQLHRLLYQKFGSSYNDKFNYLFSGKALKYYCNLKSRKQNKTQIEEIRETRIRLKVRQLIFIKEKQKKLEELMIKLISHLPYSNLLSLNGCGLLTASRIIGEVKDISKFGSSSKLAKYGGMAPQEDSSGKTSKQKKSKFGNRNLNKAFYQIALSQINGRPNPKAKKYYQKKLKEGKNKKRALRSLARKNVNIVYAMMRDGTKYDLNY